MPNNAAMRMCFEDVRNQHLLVALSGGADSVALLVLLCRQQKEYNLHITAAHLNHGIRGAQADADAAYCAELCRKLQVKLICEKCDVPAMARTQGLGLETAAREARYSFLRRAQAQCGANLIALAHHMNDQAETILMHLLRGAGPEGISGMARQKDGLYRPLLDVSKENLKQFLSDEGFAWCEDATNACADNPRNALRLNVLPEIEKSYPSAVKAIARYGQLARDESDYLSRLADHFLTEHLDTGIWGKRLKLNGTEETALMRRVLRRLCNDLSGNTSLSMEKTDELLALSRQARGKIQLNQRLCVEKTPTALYFLPPAPKKPAPVMLNLSGETELNGICRITAETGIFPIERNDPLTQVLDADTLEGACLRLRMAGDRIFPLGASGEQLLSDYMIDRKLDRPLREWIPLVAIDQQILWVCGVSVSEKARIQPDTQRMVRLKIYFTDEKSGG